MALLPVYEWAGLDDDLTRRQQWGLNVIGLALVVLGAHAVGAIDLGGISGSVHNELPFWSGLTVAALVGLAVWAVLHGVLDTHLEDTRWVVVAAVGGFFLIDLYYLHPVEFENVPSLFYWLVKPFWVGVPMFLAAVWLERNTDLSRRLAYTLAGVIGVVVLQLYYTVIPIPVIGGESVQVGLVGNLTVGVPIHGTALLLALAAVVIGIKGRRYVGGGA